MIKLKLKRKKSSREIKTLKRQEAQKSYKLEEHSKKFNYTYYHTQKKRRRSLTLYELEELRKKGISYNLHYLGIFDLKKEYKKSGNKHKLKRLYKIFPEITPEAIAKRTSYEKN